MPSFPPSPFLEGAPAQEEARALRGTAATRCLGTQLGPARVPSRGLRALGTRRGQPRGQRGRGDVAAGKGQGGRGQWQGPESLAVPGDGAAGCHPCAVRARGCPSAGRLRSRVCPRLRAHARTRGAPAGSVPAGFPNCWQDAAPLQPPRALPRPLHESPGAIKREPGAAPRHTARRSHEGVAAVPAGLHGHPGAGSTGRLARGAEGAGAEGAGAGPESHGHGQGSLQQGAGVGGGAAGQAVAVGQRGAGEAAAGVAQAAAGRAPEEDSARVASPGAARGLSGTPPDPHPLPWCSQ